MKPEQFIREQGLKKAREVVEGAPDGHKGYNGVINQYTRGVWFSRDVMLSELKRLVESLEIVNRACGAERVIDLHERYKNNPFAHKYWLGVRVDRMAQAVADYESIYGGGQ
ncbi:hypothetical protein [Acinetobacter baumannii]|uniref:hypothetical protein n=1 Tax=Acinetobacter baumannii TaxID=470 RepID=UPI0008DE353E|nr:hypothetical protein [Acinetobacter baumannii]OIB60560.1 hypothetical protein A7L04_05670 [Acinetobacter baumannii]OIB74492.1 hypothetical protein A7L08_13850 [Acinetobacter baumannii]OIF39655.1 hypothetical protein A7M41_16090 [Acinetobacter baumannii]